MLLHKYYCIGTSNRFNLKFSSPTCEDGIWTVPDIQSSIRELIEENEECLEGRLNGYKQHLFLQKSENTKSYWKVITGVWYSKLDYEFGFEPNAIIRITTKDFEELVPDKHTGKYYEELPVELYNDDRIRPFF